MKYSILSLILLASCGQTIPSLFGIRKFKEGDCLILSAKPPEEWSKPKWVVLKVGNYSYLIRNIHFAELYDNITFGRKEDFYQKVDCYK